MASCPWPGSSLRSSIRISSSAFVWNNNIIIVKQVLARAIQAHAGVEYFVPGGYPPRYPVARLARAFRMHLGLGVPSWGVWGGHPQKRFVTALPSYAIVISWNL